MARAFPALTRLSTTAARGKEVREGKGGKEIRRKKNGNEIQKCSTFFDANSDSETNDEQRGFNPGVVNWISMEQRGLKREGELTDGARLVR